MIAQFYLQEKNSTLEAKSSSSEVKNYTDFGFLPIFILQQLSKGRMQPQRCISLFPNPLPTYNHRGIPARNVQLEDQKILLKQSHAITNDNIKAKTIL